jgi:ribosomal protein L7/L12
MIHAIRRYRERTGLGLKEAQAAVQAHAQRHTAA